MFRAQRHEKPSSSGKRIVFKFSNFQALQVPKKCDKLLVSMISIETGKSIARLNKALVRNGNCQWTEETLSESIWISHDESLKEVEEYLLKFAVSMGSARYGILGEAIVNIASYFTSSRSSNSVSVPLKKCKYGTILQVTIQCLTPRTNLRVEESKYSRSNKEAGDEDYDDTGSRSDRSAATLNFIAKFPTSQDLAPISLLEKGKIMETNCHSNHNNDSAEYSLENERFCQKGQINGSKHNINLKCTNNSRSSYPIQEEIIVLKAKSSSSKSRITHDEKEQEHEESSPPVPSSASVINVGSSKNLLERAEDTIEEGLEQASENRISDLENKRVSNSQTRSDLEKEYNTSLYVKEENINNLESKLSGRKVNERGQMREIRRLKMKVSKVEKECNELTNEKLELVCELKEAKKVIRGRNETIEENHKLLEDCNLKIRMLESIKVEQEENIKLQECVSKLESQLMQVKDEHEMTRLELVKSEIEKEDLKNEVKNLQNDENLLINAQEELKYVKLEKQKLQESAENLIEECNTLQTSYEDMTKENEELYDQYSCLVIELVSETEKIQKEVEHLKEEFSLLCEQNSMLISEKSNLESSLKEVHSRAKMAENEIQDDRERSESKIQDLTTELAAIKQDHMKLISDHEKKSKLLVNYSTREERKRTAEYNLELKLTVTEIERQKLMEEAANLKDEVLGYKQKLKELKNEKSNLEASLHSVSNSFEELKAEKMSFLNKMSEFEDCKIQRGALDGKKLRLKRDLTTKKASRSDYADMKKEISRMKSANLQYRLIIQQLEGEKNQCLKKIDDLQLQSAKTKPGVDETLSKEDDDYPAKIERLEAELNEALNANNKYRIQLQKLNSKGHNSLSSVQGHSTFEGEVATKEHSVKTKSSLETELKDPCDRHLEISLKYAEVEAERGDLVMQLKTNNTVTKLFQLLERS